MSLAALLSNVKHKLVRQTLIAEHSSVIMVLARKIQVHAQLAQRTANVSQLLLHTGVIRVLIAVMILCARRILNVGVQTSTMPVQEVFVLHRPVILFQIATVTFVKTIFALAVKMVNQN